jgi:hypothetical protein
VPHHAVRLQQAGQLDAVAIRQIDVEHTPTGNEPIAATAPRAASDMPNAYAARHQGAFERARQQQIIFD